MTRKKPAKTAKPSLLRRLNPLAWVWRHKWKLGLTGLVVMVAYGLYLDALIQDKFSGKKWEVPAQVYARPMTLLEGQRLTAREVVEELELLGYRKTNQAGRSGEFSRHGQQIRIYRRAFDFADGPQPVMPVELTFGNDRLRGIRVIHNQQRRDSLRLEPWLVTRLTPQTQEDRMLVSLSDVPRPLIDMLLLVEDQDFYKHVGISPVGIVRALMANIAAGRTVQGGSTLTQQLVKNFFLTRERSLTRKAREAMMALVIELRYSKDEILQAYLNEVYLGQNGANGVHGFGLASYFYFNRPLQELTIPQLATLVGMVKGPSYYHPERHPERAIERRNLVLKIAFDNLNIHPDRYQDWVHRPLMLSRGSVHADKQHPAFIDRVRRELNLVLPNPESQTAGIRIFTTLDPLAQRRAEQVMARGLNQMEHQRGNGPLQGAMVVSDIQSGEIRALVGAKDADFKGFNRALDAQRSIGSVVKPAVYLTALEQEQSYHLASILNDEPVKLKSNQGKVWQPQNYDKTFRGSVTLLEALVNSLNVPTVKLGMAVGIDKVADTLSRLGVERDIPHYPAITLGAIELSPIEVNQFYQTIANEGRKESLHSITSVVGAHNQMLYRHQQVGRQQVSPQAAYLLNYAMHKVAEEGTAQSLASQFPGLNLAGKTGTTDDYRDSWYSGFDLNNLVTVWMGRDDNQPINMTGASGALKLYTNYLKVTHPKPLSRRFPDGMGIVQFNPDTGQPVKQGCPDSLSLPAVLDSLPPRQACHAARKEAPEKEEADEKSFWERLFGASG